MSHKLQLTTMHRRLLFCIGILLVIFWLLWSFFTFSSASFRHIAQLNQTQQQEVAEQTAFSIRLKMKDFENYINSLSISFSASSNLHSAETLSLLDSVTKYSEFDRIRLTTPDGKSFAAPGNMIDISDRPYFHDAMAGKSGISDLMVSLYNDSMIMVVYAPLKKDGRIIGTIHGALEVSLLSDTLNLTSFGGKGFLHLFQKDGGILLESANAANIQKNFQNIWDFFDTVSLDGLSDPAAVRQDVENDRSGFVSYYQNATKLSAYYTPVGFNGWYVLQVLPIRVIFGQAVPLNRQSIILVIKVLLAFMILAAITIYFVRRYQNSLLESNRKAGIRNELLRLAISNTTSHIFEYDPQSGKISFTGDKQPFGGLPRILEHGIEDIISANILAPESIEPFQTLFQAIGEKKKSSEATIKFIIEESPVWFHITLANISDEAIHSVYTVGTADNVTKQVLTELRYTQEEQFCRTMLDDLVRVYEINLTKGLFRKVSLPGEAPAPWIPYTPQMVQLRNSMVYPDDWEAFTEIADHAHLMRAYEEGISDLFCEYRMVNPNGALSWASSNTRLLLDPSSGDIKAFTYAKDITKEKEQEAALRQQAEQDMLTGLYNRKAAKSLIENVLGNLDSPCLHGFFSIDLDYFKNINDNFGHIEGDQVLQILAANFQKFVRSGDVLARMGGDEFILFLRDIHSLTNVELVAARICDSVHRIKTEATKQQPLSCSIGIALFPRDGTTFDELYKNSDIALYAAKRQGRDSYVVYSRALTMELPDAAKK